MNGTAEKIRQELGSLIDVGHDLLRSLEEKRHMDFKMGYQDWYTRSLSVVRNLIPERLADFERLYHSEKRKALTDSTYLIEDYLLGLSVSYKPFVEPPPDLASITWIKFVTQFLILKSASSRLDYILADIRGVLQADLFDSEIDAARELHKKGYIRAAGTVAGVVLERHLARVCENHKVTIRKKKPTLSDLNNSLKEADVIDVAEWRFVQHLADIRNLCGHAKNREPTADEVGELIDGVDKAVKTIG